MKTQTQTQIAQQYGLTQKEMKLLETVVWVQRYKTVAVILGVAVKTVSNSIYVICEKIGITVEELTGWYFENVHGITRPKWAEFTQADIAKKLKGMLSILLLLGVGATTADDFDKMRRRSIRNTRTAAVRTNTTRRTEQGINILIV